MFTWLVSISHGWTLYLAEHNMCTLMAYWVSCIGGEAYEKRRGACLYRHSQSVVRIAKVTLILP
jgi:hypothetical protein